MAGIEDAHICEVCGEIGFKYGVEMGMELDGGKWHHVNTVFDDYDNGTPSPQKVACETARKRAETQRCIACGGAVDNDWCAEAKEHLHLHVQLGTEENPFVVTLGETA